MHNSCCICYIGNVSGSDLNKWLVSLACISVDARLKFLKKQTLFYTRGAISSMKLRTTKTVTAVTELLVFGRFGKISPNLPKYFGCRNNVN